MPRLLHRYLAREMAVPFALGLAVFTLILFMQQVLRLAEMILAKGVPVGTVARLVAYVLPSFLALTVPMATLLAVLVAFARLSADNEVTAMKGCGVSLYQLAPPVLLLGLAAYAASTWLSLYAVPWGRQGFRRTVFEIANSRAEAGIKERVFNTDFDGLTLYVDRTDVRGGRLRGIFIADRRAGGAPAIIVAAEGRIVSDPVAKTVTLALVNGTIHRPGQSPETYHRAEFQSYDLRLDVGALSGLQRGPLKFTDLSIEEMQAELRALARGDATRNRKLVAYYEKFSMPFAAVVFAVIGVPLGIRSRRSGRAVGYPLAILVFLVYYVLLSAAETLGGRGVLPPAFAVWLPNVVLGGAGLVLFRAAAHDGRLALLDRAATAAESLGARLRGAVGRAAGGSA
ncbi:MAG TPA: LPS export ABC transporter permease LptF [Thermodesulfobacteriota bacterium]|nr:LPS export ABC transporter permease LptF [Thermodesulfobacteriota bacterium]